MGINWEGALAGLGGSVANIAGQAMQLQISADVQAKRDANLARYQTQQQNAQFAQQTALQTQQLDAQGLQNQQKMAAEQQAAISQREQEIADADLSHQRGQDDIRLRESLRKPDTVTVNNSGDTDARTKKFGEVMGTNDAEMYETTRANVMGAPALEEALNVMEVISENQGTGFMDEKLAQVGTVFGTDAGAAMQTWEGTASGMILEKAQLMAGVLSETDMKIVINGTPKFGNDPKANSVIIGIMRKGMQRNLENKASMDKWLESNPNLYGWNAPNQQGINQTAAAKANMNIATDPTTASGGFAAWKKENGR